MKEMSSKKVVVLLICFSIFSINVCARSVPGTGYIKLVASEHSGFSGISDDYIIVEGFRAIGTNCQRNTEGEVIIRIGDDNDPNSPDTSDAHRSYMTALTAKISGSLVRVSVDDAETDQTDGLKTLINGKKICYLRYIHLI